MFFKHSRKHLLEGSFGEPASKIHYLALIIFLRKFWSLCDIIKQIKQFDLKFSDSFFIFYILYTPYAFRLLS